MRRNDAMYPVGKKFLLVFFVLMFLGQSQQATLPKETIDKIDVFVNSLIDCSTLIGTNIAAVKDGETVFSKGYGRFDLETEREVTSNTLYPIASVTKSLTSVLLGKVLKENGLTWDTKVMEVLSDEEFQFLDPFVTCQVTFKDLSAHRTGVPSRNYAAFRNMTRKELVSKMRYSRAESQFRNGFTYNNNLYSVMTYIIEKLSGKKYEQMVCDELFVPLNMTSATFLHEMDLSDDRLAEPYLNDPGNDNRVRQASKQAFANFVRAGAGAGSVVSTAEDMAQYLKLHLGYGVVDGVNIFDAAVIAETHSQYNTILWSQIIPPHFPAAHILNGYGLGGFTGSYNGYRVHHLEGSLLAYASAAQIMPDAGIGIYAQGVASNFGEARLQRFLVMMYITDLLLGVEPWLDEKTVCSFPAPWLNSSIPGDPLYPDPIDTPDDLSIYLGTYGNFQYGNIMVTEARNMSSRWLELTYGSGKWSLRPIVENTFLGVPNDDTFPFYLKEVLFRNQNRGTGLFNKVTFNVLGTDPNIFQRDLKMADEPPVPTVNCNLNRDSSGGERFSMSTSYLLVMLAGYISFVL